MATVGDLSRLDRGQSPAQEHAALVNSAGPEVRDRLLKTRSFGPSSRTLTQSEWFSMESLYNSLGNPFNVRKIPYSVMRDMLEDPMLAFCFFFSRTPLVRASFSVESPDAQLAQAVDEAFRPAIPTSVLRMSGDQGFGHQPLVKQWRQSRLSSFYIDPMSDRPNDYKPVWSENVPAIVMKPPLAVPPENCIPKWDADGNFNGFVFTQFPIPEPMLAFAGGINGSGTDPASLFPGGQDVPADFAMWSVNEQDENFGSIYGAPRTKRAYRFYWSYWFRWALADRSFENKADPAKIVYYPVGMGTFTDPTDPTFDPDNPGAAATRAQQKAIELGMGARSGAVLALPGDFIVDESTGRVTNARKWEIRYLEGGQEFEHLDKTFQYLDVLKARAMLVPEQALLEGQGGTSSRNVASELGGVLKEAQQTELERYFGYLNDYAVPQWVAYHFPDRIDTPCRIVPRTIGAQDDELVSQLIQLVGQTRGEDLPVDIRELLRQRNIPLLSPQQMAVRADKAAREAAAAPPPPTDPTPTRGAQGYNAGIVKTEQGNLYIQPRDVIVLSEADNFLASLPNTPHYREAAVRSSILKLRRIFIRRYRTQYASFADHLADPTTLVLAQRAPTKRRARRGLKPGLTAAAAGATAATIVSTWNGAPGLVAGTAAALSVGAIIANIALIGGRTELKKARLSAESFGPPSVDTWSKTREAFMIESIDRTVRSEVEQWLTDELRRTGDTDEIAQAAREHFSDFPISHTERVIRAEAREAYNFGMLVAGQEAGVIQVQAHDATDGRDRTTDAKCCIRNGRIMTIDEALGETEHPYGTLYFTYLSTQDLAVVRVERFPDALDVPEGVMAAYDDEIERILVMATATEEQEDSYALAVGNRLTYI